MAPPDSGAASVDKETSSTLNHEYDERRGGGVNDLEFRAGPCECRHITGIETANEGAVIGTATPFSVTPSAPSAGSRINRVPAGITSV